jgi:hypothetical protein
LNFCQNASIGADFEHILPGNARRCWGFIFQAGLGRETAALTAMVIRAELAPERR